MNRFLRILFIVTASFAGTCSYAQPTLPEVGTVTSNGINILSWMNPYSSEVKAVYVQRSSDSVVNFATIGNVADISKQQQTFVDAHPMPGKNYYTVQVVFASGTEWKSNIVLLHVDSSSISSQKVLPPNDSIQKLVARMGSGQPSISQINSLSYTRSRYVYTNPYNGNISIELPEPFKNKYTVTFYDQNDREVLNIPRINDDYIILDRRNFQSSGVYKFKVFKNAVKFEDGFVTVY